MLNRSLILFYFISSVIFLIFSGLSHDEAYYYSTYSQYLNFGYYDHPPMVGLLIKFGSFFSPSAFGVRFLFYVLSLFGVFLFAKSNEIKFSSSLLIFFNFILFFGSSILAIPDGPLLFFTILYFVCFKKYLEQDSKNHIIGLIIAIIGMLYSKYHGGVTILFTIIAMPSILKRKSFWFIAVCSLIGFLPHLYWQFTHDFITFKFHLFGRAKAVFEIKNIVEFIFGQVILLGGLNFIGLFKFIKNERLNNWQKFLLKNIVFNFSFLVFLSFRNKMEANWTTSLIPPLAFLMVGFVDKNKKLFLINTTLISIPVFVMKLMIPLNLFPNTRLSEFSNWKELSLKIKNECQDQKILTNNYQEASQLSFYLKEDIRAIHTSGRLSQFSLMSKPDQDQEYCFISRKKLINSIKIGDDYKHEIYLSKGYKYL
jgi:hypothetical protein